MCITYVGEPWTILPDKSGVTVFYTSGLERVTCRMSRADYRFGCESTLEVLDEFELSERDHVVLPLHTCPYQQRHCETDHD